MDNETLDPESVSHTLFALIQEKVVGTNVVELKGCENLEKFWEMLNNIYLEKKGILNPLLVQLGEVVAAFAPLSANHQKCLEDHNLISVFVKSLNNEDPNIQKQACRALGNLCYDDEGSIRSLIHSLGGTESIQILLSSLLQKKSKNYDLMEKAAAFLMNYVLGCDDACSKFLDNDLLKVIIEILRDTKDTVLSKHLLVSMSMITDSDSGKKKLLAYGEKLSVLLVNMLKISDDPEVLDSCLTIADRMCEDDKGKVLLATHGVIKELIKNIDSNICHQTHEINSFIKQASDLIVFVASEDESMELLFEDGHGDSYVFLRSWLLSANENLVVAGTVILGNFARNDKNCEILVKDDVPQTLINLIQKYDSLLNDIRFQHAVFSLMRNIAVSKTCRLRLVEIGVLNTTIPLCVNIKSYPVVFRYIGMIRILCSKQENACNFVGGHEEFIKQLVNWANVEDFRGVKEESSRCIAVLLCFSPQNVTSMLRLGAFHPVLNMLDNAHEIMQLEALHAITVAINAAQEHFEDIPVLILADKVLNVMSGSSDDVFEQSCLLFKSLLKADNYKDQLMSSKLMDQVEKCPEKVKLYFNHLKEELCL